MSFIGTLDQVALALVIQRIEEYKKTGLLIVKQDNRAVELSFRCGQLLCIGPVRPGISLGDRLLQAGVITRQALEEAYSSPALDISRETAVALRLIDLGYVDQEGLYRWAMMEASQVLEVLLGWSSGELHFYEGQQPPQNRLLIALSVTSLLAPLLPKEAPQPVSVHASPPVPERTSSARAAVIDAPTLHDESGYLNAATLGVPGGPALPAAAGPAFPAATLFTPPAPEPSLERDTDTLSPSLSSSILPPQRVTVPLPPLPVNTTYLPPQVVLVPTDLSVYRTENPLLQITPEQWRLFTRADGQTSLQVAAQELAMTGAQVCRLAAELAALGLVTLSMPAAGMVNELSPLSSDYIQAGLANGYVAPGSAAAPVQPWDAVMPALDYANRYSSSSAQPVETQSQWGNGGNGATFVLGNGWVVNTQQQPSQPMRLSNLSPSGNGLFARAG